MMFGFQPLHLVVIFIVALVVFGPQKLPEIGRGLGRAIVEFRKGAQEFTNSFQDGMNGITPPNPAPSSRSTVGRQSGPVSENSRQYCIHCGAPNPVEARFCNQCGATLPQATIGERMDEGMTDTSPITEEVQ